MSQFIFTAATIHLLSVAKGKNVAADTASVERCIATLGSMGRTWKCALQCKSVLRQLLQEWHPGLAQSHDVQSSAPSPEVLDAAIEQPNAASSGASSIQETLQQNPEMAEELQRLGWVPPSLSTTIVSQGYTSVNGFVDSDMQNMDRTKTWTGQPDTLMVRDVEALSDDETLTRHDGMPPEAWADQLFGLETGGEW